MTEAFEQLKALLRASAPGAASGIMNAKDPIAMIDEMIAATRRAARIISAVTTPTLICAHQL